MAYGVPFNEINTLTEGQQADEYVKRKRQEAIDKTDKFNSRYYKYPKTGMGKGPRSQGGIYGGDQGMKVSNDYYYTATPTTDNNPRFDSARKLEDDINRYGSSMPNIKTKSERKLDDDMNKSKNKELKEREYAAKFGGEREDGRPSTDISAQAAMDAARRHYRRTHKNESSIFESVEII